MPRNPKPVVLPDPARNGTQPNKTADAMATLMVERQERLRRAAQGIEQICQQERVKIVVASLNFTPDGKLAPQIQVTALD